MFRCYEVDIVYSPNFLEFYHPISQLFRGQVKSLSLMSNVMVLTKDTSEIASREKHAPASIMTLYAGLLAEVRGNDIHLDSFGADEAVPGFVITIDATKTWAEIAVS